MNQQEATAGRGYDGWLVPLAFVLASLPLLWISMPPVVDYPNHLTRIWLLAGGASEAPLSSVYVPDWSHASTNVGVDYVMVALAQVLPFSVVDRLMRMLMFIGPPLGAACLGRAVSGRTTVWHVAPLAFAWSTTSIAGFMSYSIAIGAALFCAVFVEYRRGRMDPLTLGVHVMFSFGLLAIHPFGLLFYHALVAGLLIGKATVFPVQRDRMLRVVWKIVVFSIVGAIPVALLFTSSSSSPDTSSLVYPWSEKLNPGYYLKLLLSPILTYNPRVDVLAFLPIFVASALWVVDKRRQFHFGLLVIAILLGIAALGMPTEIGDASFLDRRLPLMAALAFMVAICPAPRDGRLHAAMTAMLLGAVLGKAAWIGGVWKERERDIADFDAVTRQIRPGDAVMPVTLLASSLKTAPLGRLTADTGDVSRKHLPTTLIMSRRAYVPTLFAIGGQHPIRVASLARGEGRHTSTVPSPETLYAAAGNGYIQGWRCSYRYLLLIEADEETSHPLDARGLTLVASRGFAALYSIDRPGAGQSCDQPPVRRRPRASVRTQ
jgi:hypothetical protein